MSNVDRPHPEKNLGEAARARKAPPFASRQEVDQADLDSALEALQAPALKSREESRKVQVVGRVHAGKIEIDASSLTEFSRKFPDAGMVFIAVNAPFDPVPLSEGVDRAGQTADELPSAALA